MVLGCSVPLFSVKFREFLFVYICAFLLPWIILQFRKHSQILSIYRKNGSEKDKFTLQQVINMYNATLTVKWDLFEVQRELNAFKN